MKKINLSFGLAAGSILTTVMVVSTFLCYRRGDFEGSMLLGYAGMLLAFSFIYAGIKRYRDRHLGGIITFGKAFKTGLYISLIASSVYVGVWLIEYYLFIPDFMEKYGDYMLRMAANKGKDLAAVEAEIKTYRDLYQNPLFVIILTYTEVLPLGLLVSLICAFVLKKKAAETADSA